MDPGPVFLERLFPVLALAALLVTLVCATNLQGRRLERHAEWLRLLQARVDNLHNEKREAYKKSLQTLRPQPPSPAEAKTIEVSEAMLLTLKLKSKEEEDPPHGTD